MDVCCECCVLSGRGLCDGPITLQEESYRVWCVWVWSRNLIENALAHYGCRAMQKKPPVRTGLETRGETKPVLSMWRNEKYITLDGGLTAMTWFVQRLDYSL